MNSKRFLSILLAMILVLSPLTPLVYAEELGKENLGDVFSEDLDENKTQDEPLKIPDVKELDQETTTTEIDNNDDTLNVPTVEDGNEKDLLPSPEAPTVMRMIIPVEPTKSFSFYLSEADANNEVDMLQEQILRDGDVLQEPRSPVKPVGKSFIGWFYLDGAIERQISFNELGQSDPVDVPANQVPMQKVVKVYAKYEESFSVYFVYNGEVLSTKEVAPAESFNDDGVIYFIDDEELSFKWWSLTENGTEFAFPATVSEDTTLYLVTKPSYKVTFDSNGGSPVLPRYVNQGDAIGTLPVPTKAGYDFDVWRASDAGIYYDYSLIISPLELFAYWTPKSVKYSVVYFLENADDTGYTYEKTVNKTGLTGSMTTLDASSAGAISHFTFNNAENVNIEGDGSTIVRVYYSRDTYQLRFRKPSGGGWSNILTQQVKHGAKTETWWNQASASPNDVYSWFEDDDDGVMNITWPLMPTQDLTFYGVISGTSNMRTIFMEIASPSNLFIKNVDFKGNGSDSTFIGGRVLIGFTWKYVTSSGEESDSYKYNDSSKKWEVKTFYLRNQYQLNFETYSNDHNVPAKLIFFEGSLAGSIPTELKVGDEKTVSGLVYEFMGWYKDPAFTDLFNFGTEKMPAHNINLHGKWIPKKHTVRYYDGIEGSELGTFKVSHGDTITEADLSGYTVPTGFKGWYRKDGNRFIHFILDEEKVLMDMDLYPILTGETYQALYKDKDGDLILDTDKNEYTSRSRAVIKDFPGNHEGKLFVGWLLEGDTSGRVYYAGENILMNSNKTFTPIFADPLVQTKIIYNAGDGLGSEKTYDVAINSKHVIKTHNDTELGFSRLGYEFTGWMIQGTLRQAGEEYLVDNEGVGAEDYSANTFVAQWQRSVIDVTATKKWVNGENARPKDITLILLRDGFPIGSEVIEEDEDGKWSFTWPELPEKDDEGNLYTYSVDEEDIDNFEKSFSEDGLTVTNTYVSPMNASFNAVKIWQGGTAPVTDVKFQLYRNIDGSNEEDEKVGDPVEMVGPGYTWTGLAKTDEEGNEYIYSFLESSIPDNYRASYNGNTVTNIYEIPSDGIYSVEKVWEGDENVTRPVMIFDLYRKTDSLDEKVPGAVEKEVDEENKLATWEKLETTDIKGNLYRFYVKESFKEDNLLNQNWVLGEDLDGEIINRVIFGSEKKAKLTVGKKLLEQLYAPGLFGGTADQVKFSFTLTGPYGFEEEFELFAGQEKVFSNLYYGSYNLVETNSQDYEAFLSESSVDLSMENPEAAIAVENRHSIDEETGVDPNLVEVKAKKVWVNGPKSDHIDVEMLLYRSLGGRKQLVMATAATSQVATGGSRYLQYLWKGLDKHSPEGFTYIYTVEEKDAVDGKYTVDGRVYEVTKEGDTITNTFIVQKIDVKGQKIWIDAPKQTPDIWFKLYRSTEGGELEEVPQAEILKVKGGEALWKEIDKTDLEGNLYSFTVREVDKDGKDFVPKDYKKEEKGLVVRNIYTKPLEKLPSTGESSLGLLLFTGLVLVGSGSFLLRKKRR